MITGRGMAPAHGNEVPLRILPKYHLKVVAAEPSRLVSWWSGSWQDFGTFWGAEVRGGRDHLARVRRCYRKSSISFSSAPEPGQRDSKGISIKGVGFVLLISCMSGTDSFKYKSPVGITPLA